MCLCVNVYRVFENIGTALGLMGCIRKLKIGRRLVELHEGQDVMVERVVGVRECGENPCSSLPCLHGATCHAIDSDTFRCACTQEFTGQNNVYLHHHSVTECCHLTLYVGIKLPSATLVETERD